MGKGSPHLHLLQGLSEAVLGEPASRLGLRVQRGRSLTDGFTPAEGPH